MSDTFFNATPTDEDEDTVYTMGGLDGLGPVSDTPQVTDVPSFPFIDAGEVPQGFDIPDYLSRIGSAGLGALSNMFPGVQAKPTYIPGLTDLTFTRGYYGPEEDVIPTAYGTESGGTLFWQGGQRPPPQFPSTSVTPVVEPPRQDNSEAILQAALGLDWSGAYKDYLNKLQAQSQDVNISNVFTPSNINTVSPNINVSQSQSQSQWQKQWQGGGGDGGGQDQDQDQGDGGFGGGGGGFGGGGGGGGFDFGGGLGGIGDTDTDEDTFQADLGRPSEPVTPTVPVTPTRPVTPKTPSTPAPTPPPTPAPTPTPTPPPRTPPEPEVSADEKSAQRAREKQVKSIYEKLFNRRDVDPAGLSYWTDQLKQGVTPEQLERNIRAGAQGSDLQAIQPSRDQLRDTVNQAYQQTFGRNADAAGLEYWTNELARGKTSTDLLRDLVSGAQGTDLAAAQNTQTVTKMYQDLLGRAPDAEGLNYYRQQLSNGVSPDQVARNIVAGARGSDVSRARAANIEDYAKQYAPKPVDLYNPLKNAADQFIKSNPNVFTPGEIAGSTVKFADFLAKNFPETVGQLLGKDSITGIPFASEVAAALSSQSFPEFAGKATASALTNYVASNLGSAIGSTLGIPGVGPALAAAIAIDSILSSALGYDSPIQDGIRWVAKSGEKAVNWVTDRAIGGDPLGSVGRFLGRTFGFQEGGLVDFPDGTVYYGDATMGQGVLPDIEAYAQGGVIPLLGGGKIARGPGGGLDDLIPTTIDGRRAAALSDGEFVIPADVVSMMGDGSTNAGSKRLYDLVRQIRQEKTGTSRQAGPLQVGKILERTMK